jgi:hypothetical protein
MSLCYHTSVRLYSPNKMLVGCKAQQICARCRASYVNDLVDMFNRRLCND